MLVLNFHAFPEAAPGGFVGVDVFFVISGFLITGIIARELDQKRFSLLGFYVRRIRRIFPALIVVLAATLVLGWLWLLPSAYAQLGSDAFFSAAFLANIALLLQSGYFDIESARKPLLHLWSLGIEEQFYLAWPLLLMLAARLRLSIVAMASVLCVASFVLNVALIGTHPVASFYLPFTRAFELLAGAVLARGWDRIDQGDAASNRRAWIGMALIAVSAAILDPHRAFPGWWALLPVGGTALLLSAPKAWPSRAVLASPPLVWIGLISYPLYLWHWPLLVFSGAIKFAPAVFAGARVDIARQRAARCSHGRPTGLSRSRFALAGHLRARYWRCAPAWSRRHVGRGRRLRTWPGLPAASGNSRDGQCADAIRPMAVS